MTDAGGQHSHQSSRRARDYGIKLEGTTGPWNAITDVAGVQVGYETVIAGQGLLEQGHGPVRSGVTAILPLGQDRVGVPARQVGSPSTATVR